MERNCNDCVTSLPVVHHVFNDACCLKCSDLFLSFFFFLKEIKGIRGELMFIQMIYPFLKKEENWGGGTYL